MAFAVQAMRSARPNLDVGIVLNLSPVYAATASPDDQHVALREDGLLVRWYMDALLRGAYPGDVLAHLGADAPQALPGDARTIAQPLDFLGVNYYHPIISSVSRPFSHAREGVPVTDMGWEVAPASFKDMLLRRSRLRSAASIHHRKRSGLPRRPRRGRNHR